MVFVWFVAIPAKLVLFGWLSLGVLGDKDLPGLADLKLEYIPDVEVEMSALDQILALVMGILAVLFSVHKALPDKFKARGLWRRGRLPESNPASS